MEDFAKFYEETYSSFCKFLILNAPRLDSVDDILQNAYVKVYEMMKKKDIQDKKAYLFKVGWNLLKKEYKLKKEISFDDSFLVNSSCIEEDVLSKITLEELWDFLKKKNIEIQKSIYLYYLGMSVKEISKSLSLSESQVKNYLYRTFKEIKEELR